MDIYTLNKGRAIQDRIGELKRIKDVLTSDSRKMHDPIDVLVEFLQKMQNVSSSTQKKEFAAMCLEQILEKCREEMSALEKEFQAL